MEMLKEELHTPITGTFDAVVAGGGVAGIAAALAAARHGAKVLLLEKQYLLGGLATAGLVTIYLPLCDGMGHQLSFGLAEELLRASIRLGAEAEYPKAWLENGSMEEKMRHRYRVRYNAQLFAIEAEKMLQKEHVTILYGASVCRTQVEDGRMTAVIVEHKSGREAIRARTFVDATGDADLYHLSGEETVLFGPGNILAAWYYSHGQSGFDLNVLGLAEIPEEDRTEESRPLISRRFQGVDGWEVSEMVQLAHDQILRQVMERRKTDASYVPATVATIPQLRMTRRIAGISTMDTADDHMDKPDSIGLIGNWKKNGPAYAVPFSALCGRGIRNLITAGRSISSTDAMWDVTRVIPACAVTGQAAGTAAALTDDFSLLPVESLQKVLLEDGVRLTLEEVGLTGKT